MSRKNSIPEFTSDPESIAVAVRAIKELLEGVLGQRPDARGALPKMFVQPVAPDPKQGLDVRRGDLWIIPGDDSMKWFDGRLWRSVST